MTILLERTQIYYLPSCQICDGDPYQCRQCHKTFNVNPNDEMYDGDVFCIRFSTTKKKQNAVHVCSIKCAEKLLKERKEKGISRSVKYEITHNLTTED